GLFRVFTLFNAFTIGALIVTLILLTGLYWAWQSFPGYREELAETNASGKVLAWIALVVVMLISYLSVFILLLQ
ncbi:MAG: hypothetical protein JNM46_09380, partial [Anaerolineales bacterium]|nr:hypothetical protein [Anaerolineales bacterium]